MCIVLCYSYIKSHLLKSGVTQIVYFISKLMLRRVTRTQKLVNL